MIHCCLYLRNTAATCTIFDATIGASYSCRRHVLHGKCLAFSCKPLTLSVLVLASTEHHRPHYLAVTSSDKTNRLKLAAQSLKLTKNRMILSVRKPSNDTDSSAESLEFPVIPVDRHALPCKPIPTDFPHPQEFPQ